jgi:hypothetical protein
MVSVSDVILILDFRKENCIIYVVRFIQIISWYFDFISALNIWECNSAKLKDFCLFWIETYIIGVYCLLPYWQVLPFASETYKLYWNNASKKWWQLISHTFSDNDKTWMQNNTNNYNNHHGDYFWKMSLRINTENAKYAWCAVKRQIVNLYSYMQGLK